MTEPYTPQAGDIGLVTMNSWAGRLIRLGQWLNGDGFENFEHAFVVTDETSKLGRPMIVEAQPNGAAFREIHYADNQLHWCRGLSHKLTPENRHLISQIAIDCIGTPYSALDYFSLVGERLNIPGTPFLTSYVKSTHHMICSQLAAWTYFKAHVPIWPAQDWTGDDTPGDLYQQDMILQAQYSLGA